jgi:hypothetical protein
VVVAESVVVGTVVEKMLVGSKTLEEERKNLVEAEEERKTLGVAEVVG